MDSTNATKSNEPWIFDAGRGGSRTLEAALPAEYGVGEYGGFVGPGNIFALSGSLPWRFGSEVGAVTQEPLVRRVGDKRAVSILIEDSAKRPCDLTGVTKITLRLTPVDSTTSAWIADLIAPALESYAGALADVTALLASLSDEVALDIPISQIVAPEKDGVLVYLPGIEFDAELIAEARLELEATGSPDAVLPSPAPQMLIVRR